MKMHEYICNHLRVALKPSALAFAMGTWLIAGTALAAPANDDFANAIDLTGVGAGQTGNVTSGTQTGTDNVDATLEAGEPSISRGYQHGLVQMDQPGETAIFTFGTLGSTNCRCH